MKPDIDAAKAVALLGAVEVAPNRYAVQRLDTSSWGGRYYVMSTNRLLRVAEHILCGDHGSTYPRIWNDGCFVEIVLLPTWWTPKRQIAWRVGGRIYEYFEVACSVAPLKALDSSERVTVDLSTGEEVTA